MDFEICKNYLCLGSLIFLGIIMIASLVRSIIGPRTADRIVGVNIISTTVIMAISILSVYLNQSWLLDVCLIYCMMSFLSTMILTKVYIAVVKKESTEEEENPDV